MIGCILLYLDKIEKSEDGKFIHYFGGYMHLENRNQYIKSFDGDDFTLTYDVTEAQVFTNDDECDRCMESMLKHGAVTICVWEYNDSSKLMDMWKRDSNKYRGIDFGYEYRTAINSPSSKHVAYPNMYWAENKRLQPSLMYSSVSDWENKHKK